MQNSNNNWYKITHLSDGITAINENGMVTMYLIEGTERALLLDTGWGIGDIASCVRSLTDLPLTVMHTHGHIDHVSGAYMFDEVLVTAEDEKLLMQSYDTEERRLHHKIFLSEYLSGNKADKWVNVKPKRVKTVEPYHVFELGKRRIIEYPFPGHTWGSAVFFDVKSGSLFTGDSIAEGALWLHTEDSAPLSIYLKSLRSLESFRGQIKLLLPAHEMTPVSPGIIEEYTLGVQDIIEGKRKGSPVQNHARKGAVCRFKRNAVIYAPEKLT